MKIKYIFTCFLFTLILFYGFNISYAIESKGEEKLEVSNTLYMQKAKYFLESINDTLNKVINSIAIITLIN